MNDLIKQARELCEKATPGPWYNFGDWMIHTEPDIEHNGIHNEKTIGTVRANNAAFIAASRTLVPQLRDALEAEQKEIEQLKTQCDINATSFFDMREQLKNAAAERDTYKEALSHLEHMVSGERSGNRKREHSIGVMAALCKAREVLKGVE